MHYAAGMLVNIALIIGGVAYLVWMSTQGEADIIHQSNVLSVMLEASSLLLAVWIMFHAFKDNPKRPNLLGYPDFAVDLRQM
ncbi:MAG TPA: hypothetical protein ENI98_10105 [Gammaproteobacteria bacterium]|nr:hypothetical protein [Gammaproteobacteria bacterium]